MLRSADVERYARQVIVPEIGARGQARWLAARVAVRGGGPFAARTAAKNLRVAIDLSAVPPLGLGGIEATDKAAQRDNMVCYGAIGVGDTKMKIHKAAIRQLFEANDQVLDAEEIYRIGQRLAT